MPISPDSIEKKKVRVCLKYHLHNCCGICELKPGSEHYQEWIDQARKLIKGDAHEIGKHLEQEMSMKSAELKFEEAADIKRKIEMLEQFKSKTIITNSSAKDVDVFGYDEQDDRVYISMLHVHNGSIQSTAGDDDLIAAARKGVGGDDGIGDDCIAGPLAQQLREAERGAACVNENHSIVRHKRQRFPTDLHFYILIDCQTRADGFNAEVV